MFYSDSIYNIEISIWLIAGLSKAGDSNNSFFDHLQKNPSHEIDWGKVTYLDKEQNTDIRIFKESLYQL